MPSHYVEKPIHRGKWRHLFGKEYYILKRKIRWYCGRERYARVRTECATPHLLIEHQSTLLRQLKEVDMELQYNKITNLRLAIAKIDQVEIHPGRPSLFGVLSGVPLLAKVILQG